MYKDPIEKLVFKGPRAIEFIAKNYEDDSIPTRCDTREKLLQFLNGEVQHKLKYNNAAVYATLALNTNDFNSLLDYVRDRKIKYTLTNRVYSKEQEKKLETQQVIPYQETGRVQNIERYSAPADNRPIKPEDTLPFKLVD